MRDAGAGRATTDRLPGATPPSYTTSIAHTIYVSVVRPKEVTESDQAAAETILQTSFGSSSSKNLLASLQENHGERLRLVLLHMGDTNTLAAVATLARLRNGWTLVENLCVRDQHRSRGLTRNLLDGIATSIEDHDLFLFARSQVLLEVCQSSGYLCLEGDDRKRVVNTFVQETDLAYDSRYYLTVPLLKYAIGTSRRYDRSLDWEENGAGSEDDVARIREDDNAVTMAPGIRNGEDDARSEYDGVHDREDPSAQKEPRGTRKKTDYAVRRRAHAVEVKRLPDGPVTSYKSQAEAACSEGWSKSTLSDWLCGRHTKCTIPAGYAIRRSTSDDWIRNNLGGTGSAPTSATSSGAGVRNEEGGTRDKAATSDATMGKDLLKDCRGSKKNAVQVKRLPDGPVTPYKSQAEAARSEGWSKSTLSDWLCGRHTKCTIPVGYAIRRSTSDDWIRHDSGHDYGGTVDTAPSSGATTSGAASSTPNEDGFLKEGPYMNCRLRIQRPRYAAYGTVVKYLPGSENDGIELWKVRHDDGDEEDVELHELMQWICKRPKEGV